MNTPQDETKNVNPEDPGGPVSPGPPQALAQRPTNPTPQYGDPRAGASPSWSNAMDPRRKSVALASFLSMLPGLGQVYLGYYQLGFIHILIAASVITLLSAGAGPLTPLLGVSLAFFWLYNIVDAGRRAALYNAALARQAGSEMPEIELPVSRGSRVGGIFLVTIGVLFLMYTRFDFDMYWVEDWWPLGLIILGGWLFIRDRSNKTD